MRQGPWSWAPALGLALATAAPATAADAPKYGDTLIDMIPADAPPSFDAHREQTYATIHSAAPFYSVLIRANPDNPSSPTDFVCDVCTATLPRARQEGASSRGTRRACGERSQQRCSCPFSARLSRLSAIRFRPAPIREIDLTGRNG